MRNRLNTERSARLRGNPYYRLPSYQRMQTEGSDPLHLTLQSDHSKCTRKYGRSVQATIDSLSNKNLTAFRDIVVQTKGSILPFLNSLRHHPSMFNAARHEVQPFEVSLKPTCNSKVPKRVCDLTQSHRLNDLTYLWEGPCSQSKKNTIQYDCMLRDYGGKSTGPKFSYVNTRRKYESTIEQPIYQQSAVICDKFRRNLKSKK